MDPLSIDLSSMRTDAVIADSNVMDDVTRNIVGIEVQTEEGTGELATELAQTLAMEFTDAQMIQVSSMGENMQELVFNRIDSTKTMQEITLSRSQDQSTSESGNIISTKTLISNNNKVKSTARVDDNNLIQRGKRKRDESNVKVDTPMITLVQDSVIELGTNAPFIHHVNENFVNLKKDINRSNMHCFLCNAKLAVSARGAVNILDKAIVTSHRQVSLSSALSDVLLQPLEPTSPLLHKTSLLCKKCFKQLEDHDGLLGQLEAIRQDMLNKYNKTDRSPAPAVCSYEPQTDSVCDTESIIKKEEDVDPEFKVYMTLPETRRSTRGKSRSRGRSKGIKRNARSGQVRVDVKTEGAEEEEDDAGDDDDWDTHADAIHMTINSTSLQPLVEVREMNGTESGHHFLDVSSHTSEEEKVNWSDEVIIDCLDARSEGEIKTATKDLSASIKDISQFARIMFALPVDGAELVASTWERFKCLYCHTTSRLYDEVANHIKECHPDKLYECEVCSTSENSVKFSKRLELVDHLEEHLQQDIRQLKCDSCPKRFGLPRSLRQHKKHHLAKTVQCPHCTRRFKTDTALQEHQYTHTGVRPFRCEHCHKRFNSRYNLKLHGKTHQIRERKYKCEVCSKEFLQFHHLVEHTHVHAESKNFICDVCGKGFTSTRSLDLHMLIHTGVKNYTCRICNKQFARKGEVEDHERTHTGEKPFQCEICGATFSQRSNLQSHKRATHYKEKKHQCEQCNRAFKRRRLLVYHIMSVHTGERPYKCLECNASFVYPEHYKKHMRIHTGEKPFSCDVCGKAFNSRDNRNAHKFIHSERKPYECTICNVGFMRKPMLMTHILQHDGPIVAQPEMYVRVNPASVADEMPDQTIPESNNVPSNPSEEQTFSPNSLRPVRMNPDNCDMESGMQIVNAETMEVVSSRNFQIIDSDDLPRYILQNNVRGSFLASFEGQVVEVRPDDLHTREDGLYEFSEEGVVGIGEEVEEGTGGEFELQLTKEGGVEEMGEVEEMELQTVEAGRVDTNPRFHFDDKSQSEMTNQTKNDTVNFISGNL